MALKKMPPHAGKSGARPKKVKQPTQKSPKGRRVMVVGPSGKVRFEWMP